MTPEAIGAVLLVLVVVFFFSRVWFHFVEGLLGLMKRLFCKKADPPAWHPLPKEEEEDR